MFDVVLTQGDTWIAPTARPLEYTRAVLDYEIPGIAEAMRPYGVSKVPASALSPGGVAGRTLVGQPARLHRRPSRRPGRPRRPLAHAVDQFRGGDHLR